MKGVSKLQGGEKVIRSETEGSGQASQLEVEDFLMNQDSRVEMSIEITFTGRNRDRLQINLVFMSADIFRNCRVHSFYIPHSCLVFINPYL